MEKTLYDNIPRSLRVGTYLPVILTTGSTYNHAQKSILCMVAASAGARKLYCTRRKMSMPSGLFTSIYGILMFPLPCGRLTFSTVFRSYVSKWRGVVQIVPGLRPTPEKGVPSFIIPFDRIRGSVAGLESPLFGTSVSPDNGKRCNIGKTTTGVTQRSVLGPFVFLIYINDLPQTCQRDI